MAGDGANDSDDATGREGCSGASCRRVIVAGYGPVGRVVAEKLEATGVDVTIVELNLDTIERQRSLDKTVIYGDISDRQVLELAGTRDADALVLTIPDEKMALNACRIARELAPHLYIAARTNFVSEGLLATQAGADCVIVEEVVTAVAMKEAVLRRFAIDDV